MTRIEQDIEFFSIVGKQVHKLGEIIKTKRPDASRHTHPRMGDFIRYREFSSLFPPDFAEHSRSCEYVAADDDLFRFVIERDHHQAKKVVLLII